MNSERKIEEINTKYNKIEDLRNEVFKSIYQLYLCAHFKSDAICNILAELATVYEKKKYVPMKFKTYFKARDKYYYDYYVINASKKEECKQLSDVEKLTHEDVFKVGKAPYNETYEGYNIQLVEMGFLIDMINNKLNLPHDYRIIKDNFGIYYYVHSLSDFYGRDYIKNFIEHLFELQVQKDGNHLTYEEMQQALSEFMKKSQNSTISKRKTKDKNML